MECDLKQLNDIAEDLYEALQQFSGAIEEGTRNVLSECLGRTVIAKPELCARLQVWYTPRTFFLVLLEYYFFI